MSPTTLWNPFPLAFLVIKDIAEFTRGKVPVKGTLFELCINSDFKFVHIFAAEKNIIPRQNIQTIFVEFCGDEGTIVSMSINQK